MMNFETIRNDFEVKYRFLTFEEGGRKTGPPYQGYRCDWLYKDDLVESSALREYMIWPIFMDEKGNPWAGGSPVPNEGIAQMVIVSDEWRSIHRRRIDLGTEGYFMEGPRRVAEASVNRVVDLLN